MNSNIYPDAGESLRGETRQVFFVNKEHAAKSGDKVCLIGNLNGAEWMIDDVSCVVYGDVVKLMVPENLNVKSLELRVHGKSCKLQDLRHEGVENNCRRYGLEKSGLVSECKPTRIALFSRDKEETLLRETVVLFPNMDIRFNRSVYYGNMERKATITVGNESREVSWTNRDGEVKCPMNEGVLLLKAPCFRWRIYGKEWRDEPVKGKSWYKCFLENGDLLEVDNPREDKEMSLFLKINGKSREVAKNKGGKFEIGRAIYSNEGEKDIFAYCSDDGNKFELFNVATKEHFTDDPLVYRNGTVCWDVENTFTGDKDNEFFIVAKTTGENEKIGGKKVGATNVEFSNFEEDVYEITVKIKDKNIFATDEKYRTVYEGELIVGNKDKFRFKNKKLSLESAICHDKETVAFRPKYYVDELELVEEDENVYYRGRLCVTDKNGNTRILNAMTNEKQSRDEINPVRIELRNNSTFWLVAGWKGGSDFLGTLFLDKIRGGICNIAREDKFYGEINIYKFKEEDHVQSGNGGG